MKNPYQSSRMVELKKRFKFVYSILCVILAPKYALWCLSEKLPRFLIRLDEFWRFLMTPVRAVWGFLNAWAEGRLWKKLWVASPVLVMMLVGFSVFYINANKNRGRAYASYYQGAVTAMQEGDFQRADGLFAKLIHHPSYKDNDEVLYRAMLSASQSGNSPRVSALQKKLLEERDYEPVKRWVVERFISQSGVDQLKGVEYSEMAEKMIKEATDDDVESYWRLSLARIRVKLQNYDGALEVLKADKELKPQGYLLLAQILVISGDKKEFVNVLNEMLAYIELKDPDEQLYFSEKVEGWALIAANTRSQESAAALIPQAIDLVKRKRTLSIYEREKYSNWLSELHIRMFRFALKSRDFESRRQGFEHFDNALFLGGVSDRAGESILSVVNSTASYSLLSGQILDVAVKEGGCGAHLAIGMEAWLQNDIKAAILHFRVAHSIEPRSLDVLRASARDLAKRSVSAQLDLAVFRGVNRSNYQKSQDLLDLIVGIDKAQSVNVSFDKSFIFALRDNWQSVVDLLEPSLEQMTGENLIHVYGTLANAYANLGDEKRAGEYKRLSYIEARKQRGNND